MKRIFDPAIQTATDVLSAAQKLVDDGVSFFKGNLGKLPLFASIVSSDSPGCTDCDETHYFLVPFRLSEAGYALYTQRVLPEGVGPENNLPKARLFHLPADGTISTIEGLLHDQLKEEHLQQIDPNAPLASRLDAVADEIDKQSNLVTGGLIVVGGVVALANPLLGVGIAAKAILPSLGSKLSKHGIHHVSDWLRDRKSQSIDKDAGRKAEEDIKRLSPKVEINETLALLEEALATSDVAYDPCIRFSSMMNTPEQARQTIFTSLAISCVYQDCLEQSSSHGAACLHKADVTWLKSLKCLAAPQ